MGANASTIVLKKFRLFSNNAKSRFKKQVQNYKKICNYTKSGWESWFDLIKIIIFTILLSADYEAKMFFSLFSFHFRLLTICFLFQKKLNLFQFIFNINSNN